jgi:hypothetical protein
VRTAPICRCGESWGRDPDPPVGVNIDPLDFGPVRRIGSVRRYEVAPFGIHSFGMTERHRVRAQHEIKRLPAKRQKMSDKITERFEVSKYLVLWRT